MIKSCVSVHRRPALTRLKWCVLVKHQITPKPLSKSFPVCSNSLLILLCMRPCYFFTYGVSRCAVRPLCFSVGPRPSGLLFLLRSRAKPSRSTRTWCLLTSALPPSVPLGFSVVVRLVPHLTAASLSVVLCRLSVLASTCCSLQTRK